MKKFKYILLASLLIPQIVTVSGHAEEPAVVTHPTCVLHFLEGKVTFPNAIHADVILELRKRGYKFKFIHMDGLSSLKKGDLFAHSIPGWCVLRSNDNPFLPDKKICDYYLAMSLIEDAENSYPIVKNDIEISSRLDGDAKLKRKTLDAVLNGVPHCEIQPDNRIKKLEN